MKNRIELHRDYCKIEIIKTDKSKHYAYCSIEDHDKIKNYKWALCSNGRYCTTCINGRLITMTKLVMGKLPYGYVWDHRNDNKIDNRRQNLQALTISQNVLKGKKKFLMGIFAASSRKYRVRTPENKFSKSLELGEAILERIKYLQTRGYSTEDAYKIIKIEPTKKIVRITNKLLENN